MDRLVITSAQNPRIKDAAALRDRKERERQGLLLVEGAREIGRALAAGWVAESVFVCVPSLSAAARAVLATLESARVRMVEVSAHVFEKLALREGSDGIAVTLRARTQTVDDVLAASAAQPPALIVALHGIEKPGNVGAVLRTADGVGATGVIALEGTSDPWSPNAIRASLGTVFALPLAVTSSDALLAAGRARDITFYAAALGTDARAPWELDLRGPCCVVLGAEDAGLPPSWLGAADQRVLIPMRGIADSLNVAAAGAMILYEALRQRSAT